MCRSFVGASQDQQEAMPGSLANVTCVVSSLENYFVKFTEEFVSGTINPKGNLIDTYQVELECKNRTLT